MHEEEEEQELGSFNLSYLPILCRGEGSVWADWLRGRLLTVWEPRPGT